MAKTYKQLEAERRQKLEKRRRILLNFPNVYRHEFDAAYQKYLEQHQEDLKKVFGDNLADPVLAPILRNNFVREWSEEAQELSRKYHLMPVWDPYGERPPQPVSENPVRALHRQAERIWLDEVRPEEGTMRILPYATNGRFLLIEIDLNKPRLDIEASLMAIIDNERMELKSYQINKHKTMFEYIPRPEPRDRSSAHRFAEMKVFCMVENAKSENQGKKVSKIITELAIMLCKEEGWDRSYGDFEDDPESEDRIKKVRKALISAYKRDKKIYYGE